MRIEDLAPTIDKVTRTAWKRALSDSLRKARTASKRGISSAIGIAQGKLTKRSRLSVSRNKESGQFKIWVAYIFIRDVRHKVRRQRGLTYVSTNTEAGTNHLSGAFRATVRGSHKGIFRRGNKKGPAVWVKGKRLWLPISQVHKPLSDLMHKSRLESRINKEFLENMRSGLDRHVKYLRAKEAQKNT